MKKLAAILNVENKFNRYLLIGTINHTALLAIVYISYVLAGFTFEGQEFGGLMMAYGIILFFPQVAVELAVFGTLIKRIFQTKISEINLILLTLFLVTLAFVVMLEFIL